MVDFSRYSAGTVLVEGETKGGNLIARTVVIDEEGGGLFTLRARTAQSSGESWFRAVVEAGYWGGNYLRLSDGLTKGGGRPFNFVAETGVIDPATEPARRYVRSADFRVMQSGKGQLNMGLFSAARAEAGFLQAHTMGDGATRIDTAVALSLSLNAQNGVRVNRTGKAAEQHVQTFNRTEGWREGTATYGGGAVFQWKPEVVYRAQFTLDTATGAMSLALIDLARGAEVFSVESSFADLGEQASKGGLRFAIGNLESNTVSDWEIDILRLEASEEPAR